MNQRSRLIFISILIWWVVIFLKKAPMAEIIYKGVEIPKFPAPALPKDYEPPDWKNYPWFPRGHPERFDINQPNAAEKLMWLEKDTYDVGWVLDGNAHTMDKNRFGHIRNMRATRAVIYYYNRDFRDLLSYHEEAVNPGDIEFKDIIYFNNPPQMRGLANLTWKYVESPAKKKEQERWVYIPALRRTRRLATGADDDKIGGTDMTIDDVGQREVWEEEYRIIGEDLITPDEHTAYHYTPKEKAALEEWKEFPPYLPKNGFDCWVILGVNRKAKYYIPKRLIWIDKRKFLTIREEQFDTHGNLWKIYEKGWLDKTSRYNPEASDIPTERYPDETFFNIYDLKIDHRSIFGINTVFFDLDAFIPWAGQGPVPDSFFDVKRLEREEWGRIRPSPPLARSLEEILPIPKLRRGVFPQYRSIILPEELEKKLIKEYGE